MRVKDAGCLSLNKVPEEGGLAESRLPVDFVRNSLEAIYPCCVRYLGTYAAKDKID